MESVFKSLIEPDWEERGPAEWDSKRRAIRAAFVELLGEGAPTAPPALEVIWHGEERLDGLTLRKVSYLAEADDRVPAWLVVPDQLAAPAPAVICLHGTTADAKEACIGRGS
ncbi:MAG: hypothetical protein HUU35_19020, partial [Armatimonadetes bacterium]|nr:hypothetical protein [Armatimonadota bacterium]